MTGKISTSGNIQSMLNYSTSCVPYCYRGIFRCCTSLTKAPELPATTLAKYYYCEMFIGCTSLTKAPELPATALANTCYLGMFSYCSNLKSKPKLNSSIEKMVYNY